MCLGAVALRAGGVSLDALRGLGRRMPLTMSAFVVGGLSLIGVPFTVGFVSKWTLVVAALEEGAWPVAVVVLLSSLVALGYVWRVVEAAYFTPPPRLARRKKRRPPCWSRSGSWPGRASTSASIPR